MTKILGVCKDLTANVAVRKGVKNGAKQIAKGVSKVVPYVAAPVVFYILRDEKDFKRHVADLQARNRYVSPQAEKNVELISELEKKGVILEQRAWEAPRFNNNYLTDDAYEDIAARISSSNKLTYTERKKYMQQLARSNNKKYEPPFKGNEEAETANTVEETTATTTQETPQKSLFERLHEASTGSGEAVATDVDIEEVVNEALETFDPDDYDIDGTDTDGGDGSIFEKIFKSVTGEG